MIYRLIALFKDVRQVYLDAAKMRQTLGRKYGWMAE